MATIAEIEQPSAVSSVVPQTGQIVQANAKPAKMITAATERRYLLLTDVRLIGRIVHLSVKQPTLITAETGLQQHVSSDVHQIGLIALPNVKHAKEITVLTEPRYPSPQTVNV